MSPREKIFAEALALPTSDKADLVRELLKNLDGVDDDAEQAWLSEVERRAREIAEGSVEPVEWSDVVVEMRGRYGDE